MKSHLRLSKASGTDKRKVENFFSRSKRKRKRELLKERGKLWGAAGYMASLVLFFLCAFACRGQTVYAPYGMGLPPYGLPIFAPADGRFVRGVNAVSLNGVSGPASTFDLFATNAYSVTVNNVTYTNGFSNCDGMLHALTSDPALWHGSNSLGNVPVGGIFKIHDLGGYPFENPIIWLVPSNYPSFYKFEGDRPLSSFFHYDGTTNLQRPAMTFSTFGTNYAAWENALGAGAQQIYFNFEADNVGFFGTDFTNSMVFIGGDTTAQFNNCWGGEDSGLTNAGTSMTGFELGTVPGINMTTVAVFTRADNGGLIIRGGLWQGGYQGFHYVCDHADIEPTAMASYHNGPIADQCNMEERIVNVHFVSNFGSDCIVFEGSPFSYNQGHYTLVAGVYPDTGNNYILSITPTNGLPLNQFVVANPLMQGGNGALIVNNPDDANVFTQVGNDFYGSPLVAGSVQFDYNGDNPLFYSDGNGHVTANSFTAGSFSGQILATNTPVNGAALRFTNGNYYWSP